MASLFVVKSEIEADYYPLGMHTSVVGRDEALPIQVLDNQISRKHLQIYYNKDKKCFFAADMKSKNGVFINGKKIEGETPLASNDRIKIGNTNLVFMKEDFPDVQSALNKYKKTGERRKSTL
jgi:pSer/pThr/pTyr-binding forkhead associated (FHA) protein